MLGSIHERTTFNSRISQDIQFTKFFITLGSALLSAMLTVSAGCSLSSESVGIRSIEKTATNGLVDTYTIYYTDGTTTTFEITNGADGKDGENGKDGAQGEKGEQGENATGSPVSIVSIEKTATNGLVDTYTIYYSNGTTSTFEITNGADGENATAGDSVSQSKAINDCLRSVGKVYTEFTEPNEATVTPYDTKQALYTGACIIYRMDEEYTYFVTNYHVVYDEKASGEKLANTVHCYLFGSEDRPIESADESGKKYIEYGDYAIQCEYIGGAAAYDIAVVRAQTSRVKEINQDVQAVTLARDYYVGESAIAIGNPNGEGISVTEGIVSVDSEYISLAVDGTTRSYRSIRIDTALYKGNSGGGLFNANGELIGIANAGKLTDQNINYAIPIEIVKAVTENVLFHANDGDEATNGVYKTTIGVTVKAINSRYVYDKAVGYGKIKEDITVLEVNSESIAQTLGLQAGDFITAIEYGGTVYQLDRYFDIADHLLYLTKGVAFRFSYTREGEENVTQYYTIAASNLALVG